MSACSSSIGVRARCAAACLSLACAGAAHAVDLNSQDAVAAPAGVDAVLGYVTYATRSSFVTTDGSKLDKQTHLNSMVEIFRYVHYMDIGGVRVGPQVLVPHGNLYDARLGGAALGSAAGMADPILAAPVWLVHDTQTNFTIIPYVYVPVGSYQAGQNLNVGENRWKFDAQLALAQQLGHGIMLQVSADVMAYGDNDKAGASGQATLKQDSSQQLQAWLSYVPASAPTWHMAAGYSKTTGGTQRLDGIENGQKTDVSQWRLEAGKFLTPSLQLLVLLQRDSQVRGGFEEDQHVTVRLLKVF